MNRGKFLKTLLGIAVAPKVLAEVNLAPAPPIKEASYLSSLIKLPHGEYYRQMVERYGSESYALFEKALWQGSPPEAKEFYHYEKARGVIASISPL